MRPLRSLAPSFLFLLAASTLAAQTGGLELTVYAGPNYSWQSGTAVEGTDGQLGVSIGLHLHQPIQGNWSVDPELNFAYKGANSRTSTSTAGERVVSSRLWYLQVPVPIRFAVFNGPSTRVRLFAGPFIAIRAGCTAELESAGLVASESCTDLHPLSDTTVVFDPYKTWDAGFVAGAGFSFPLFHVRFDVDLRYEAGLLNVSRLTGTVRNRTVMLAVGVPF